MIKPIATIIAIALAMPDGGVHDAPLIDRDAGVFQVHRAEICGRVDGATDGGGWTCAGGGEWVGDGWVLSQDRMRLLGEELAKREQTIAALEAQPQAERTSAFKAAVIGLGVGFVIGVGLTLYGIGGLTK